MSQGHCDCRFSTQPPRFVPSDGGCPVHLPGSLSMCVRVMDSFTGKLYRSFAQYHPASDASTACANGISLYETRVMGRGEVFVPLSERRSAPSRTRLGRTKEMICPKTRNRSSMRSIPTVGSGECTKRICPETDQTAGVDLPPTCLPFD